MTSSNRQALISHWTSLVTFTAYAAGTVMFTLGVALFVQILAERSLEHLARIAGGESDFERNRRPLTQC